MEPGPLWTTLIVGIFKEGVMIKFTMEEKDLAHAGQLDRKQSDLMEKKKSI